MKLAHLLTQKLSSEQKQSRNAYCNLRGVCIEEAMRISCPSVTQVEKTLWMHEVIASCDRVFSPTTTKILNILSNNPRVQRAMSAVPSEIYVS